MKKERFNLMQFFEGYVRNYRKLNLSQLHNFSMFTKREIEHFANLGEMLGFDVFIEDSKLNDEGYSRAMDLSWWKQDARLDDESFLYLALHLERENQAGKDIETIEKLFTITENYYIPHNVIGIQVLKSPDRIDFLNNLVVEKNTIQQSNVLMIYRFYDKKRDVDWIHAYSFTSKGIKQKRVAVSKVDESGYWNMCFEEEYTAASIENGLSETVHS